VKLIREAILNECHTQAGKGSEEAIAKKEAEMNALKKNYNQITEEWAALKLEDKKKERMDTKKQRPSRKTLQNNEGRAHNRRRDSHQSREAGSCPAKCESRAHCQE
jgi:hypothetical protein